MRLRKLSLFVVLLTILQSGIVFAKSIRLPTPNQFLQAISIEGDTGFETRKIMRWRLGAIMVDISAEDTAEAQKARAFVAQWLIDFATRDGAFALPIIALFGESADKKNAQIKLFLGSDDYILSQIRQADLFFDAAEYTKLLEQQKAAGLSLCSGVLGARPNGRIERGVITLNSTKELERCVAEEFLQAMGLRGEFHDNHTDSVLNAKSKVTEITETDCRLLQLLYNRQFELGERPSKAKVRRVIRKPKSYTMSRPC